MVSWIDFLSLSVTVVVFGGTIYGVVYIVRQVTESVQTTKEKMKDKGYSISQSGVSIKTSKRYDRQDYIDATRRGMMKTMTAASFNRRADSVDDSQFSDYSNSSANNSPTSAFHARPGNVERAPSTASVKSSGSSEKKRGFFGKRNSN